MLANGGNGSDALCGALTIGGAEFIAPQLAQSLYGTSDPQKLTQNQKNNLRFLKGTTAGLIGANKDNPLMGAMAMQAADNSLNHNFLSNKDGVLKEEIFNRARNYYYKRVGFDVKGPIHYFERYPKGAETFLLLSKEDGLTEKIKKK